MDAIGGSRERVSRREGQRHRPERTQAGVALLRSWPVKSATRIEKCVACRRQLPFHSINNGTTRCKMCVVARAAEREERNERITQLRREGKTTREIAALMGISQTMVRFALQTAAVSGFGRRHEKPVPSGPRCSVCSLLLPHDICLAPIWAVASQRRAESA